MSGTDNWLEHEHSLYENLLLQCQDAVEMASHILAARREDQWMSCMVLFTLNLPVGVTRRRTESLSDRLRSVCRCSDRENSVVGSACDGRSPGGFSRNMWVMLPILTASKSIVIFPWPQQPKKSECTITATTDKKAQRNTWLLRR